MLGGGGVGGVLGGGGGIRFTGPADLMYNIHSKPITSRKLCHILVIFLPEYLPLYNDFHDVFKMEPI